MRAAVKAAGRVAVPVARATEALSRNQSLTVVGWHRLGDAPDGLTTTFDDFRAHLDVIEAWSPNVLRLGEAHRLLRLGQLPPRAIVLTFDDGYASVLEQAWPELQRRGLPATLFAVSGYLGGNRTFPWDDAHTPGSDLIRLAGRDALCEAAAEGLDVGSHTVTHRWLSNLSPREVEREVRKSRVDLEDLLGRQIRSFAYPMGGWTPSIRDEVERAGYSIGVTVDRGRNRLDQDQHLLRRAFAFDDPADVQRQLHGAFTWMRPIENRRNRMVPTW